MVLKLNGGTIMSKRDQRIKEIRKRLVEYKKHCNDTPAYDPEEIDAIRELHAQLTEDIEFLLQDRKKILKSLKDAEKNANNLRHEVTTQRNIETVESRRSLIRGAHKK